MIHWQINKMPNISLEPKQNTINHAELLTMALILN
ncbi:hypothetical protein YPC_2268 [Yersinia pestis biovar Medievalis str. Harbin 35]|nr:hypothetical protein YPC_2268 [Yersinia pestis biovar Medievalis str. Harbin 35]EEO80893.1 hypothetical protein YPF_2538 [Yersinia pestis biovar Orientalis str. India 195]QOW14070.1 hypothetical protein S96127_1765 [Yersinia pestis]